MSINRNETAAVADVFAERVRHNQGRLRAKLSRGRPLYTKRSPSNEHERRHMCRSQVPCAGDAGCVRSDSAVGARQT